MKHFKRFIVFQWADFDPPPPFDCIIGSFDEEPEAACFFYDQVKKDKDLAPPETNFCVFDCDERKVIYLHEVSSR